MPWVDNIPSTTGPAKGRQSRQPYVLGVLNSMMWSVLVREIPHLGIGEYRHLYRSLFEMTLTDLIAYLSMERCLAIKCGARSPSAHILVRRYL